jgi:transposase-like protein
VAQILHGSATTTQAIRAAIQRSQASIQALSERYGINQKAITNWRRRTSPEDQAMVDFVTRAWVGSKGEGLSRDRERALFERETALLSPIVRARKRARTYWRVGRTNTIARVSSSAVPADAIAHGRRP